MKILLIILFSILLPFQLSSQTYFTFQDKTGNSATIGIPLDANPAVDGVPLQPGDEIGVFTPAGLCVGASAWRGDRAVSITVWGNDIVTEEIDGIEVGEEMHFRIWLKDTDTEVYYVEVGMEQNNYEYKRNGIYRVESVMGVTPPAVPVPSSPENDAADLPLDVTIEWDEADRAASYSLQVSEAHNFSDMIVDEPELTGTEFEVNDLRYGTKYFWRTRSHNPAGESDWSDTAVFTTERQEGTMNITLLSGWNMISGFVIPADPDFEKIFETVDDTSLFVKNIAGEVYWPQYGIYELDTWNVTESYVIYTGTGHDLTLNGELIDPSEMTIPLSEGWNYPAYYNNKPLPVGEALASVEDAIELVTTIDGRIYWPQFNINDIDNLQPGEGYKVYVHEAALLEYPPFQYPKKSPLKEELIAGETAGAAGIPDYYTPEYTNTGAYQVLLFKTPFARANDEIGVWDTDGQLTGAGKMNDGKAAVVVWGNNTQTGNIKDGAYENEPLRITWYSRNEDTEREVTVQSIQAVSGRRDGDHILRYQSDGIVIVSSAASNVPVDVPSRYSLEQNYPNPFNPHTVIRYAIPESAHVRLSVYTLTGEKISVLVNQEKEQGHYEVSFDAASLPSGVYFYRLNAGYFIETKRMVLVR